MNRFGRRTMMVVLAGMMLLSRYHEPNLSAAAVDIAPGVLGETTQAIAKEAVALRTIHCFDRPCHYRALAHRILGMSCHPLLRMSFMAPRIGPAKRRLRRQAPLVRSSVEGSTHCFSENYSLTRNIEREFGSSASCWRSEAATSCQVTGGPAGMQNGPLKRPRRKRPALGI
jgi:hypothetical protein